MTLERASLEALDAAVRSRRRELDRRQGQVQALAQRGRQVKADIIGLKTQISAHEQVAVLLNTIGETKQAQAQQQIEALVTAGLQAIFEPNLSFHIIQKQTARSATVEFVIRSRVDDPSAAEGYQDIDTDVLSSRGGGLSATVGFLLRLVVALLTKAVNPTPASTLLVLDETFAHVSADYLDRVADFLRQIVDKTGIQILLITHQTELTESADKIYRFELDEAGATRVENITPGGGSEPFLR